MSGSTIGGVVGAAVGFFVPVIGPALGATIGSFFGGIIAPPTIDAPSIGDAQRQSIQPGLPRPKALGMPAPFACAVIDGETIARKITVKTKQGKGGPTIKEEKFLLTSALGCGEPGEIIWIEYDGVVVLDRRPADMLPEGWEGYSEEVKTAQAKFLENARLYNGSEDQLPDPALEAIHGVGNTPAFRGTSYFVHEDVDRTFTKGTAGQYRVMVASCATISGDDDFLMSLGPAFYYPMNDDPCADVTGNHGDLTLSPGAVAGNGVTFAGAFPNPGSVGNPATGALAGGSGYEATVLVRVKVDDEASPGLKNIFAHTTNTTFGFTNWSIYLRTGFPGGTDPTNMTPQVTVNNQAGAGTSLNASEPIFAGATYVLGFRVRNVSGTSYLDLIINGNTVATTVAVGSFGGGGYLAGGFDTFLGTIGDAIGFDYALSDSDLYRASTLIHPSDDLIPVPDAPGTYYNPETGETIQTTNHSTADLCAVTLQEIVEEIADRCNVPADKIDCSALAGITVPGFLLSQQIPGKTALEPLMLAYNFDLPSYDGKIMARLRGGPIAFTITNGQLLATGEDDETIRPQAMEFPKKVSVITQEPEANYAAIPQTSVRKTPDVRALGEVTINLAIPLPADDAMQVAEKVHKILFAQAEAEATLSLPPDFATMIASDPIAYDNRRWLVTKTDYVDGALRIEAKYERAGNYESNATGTAPTPPTPPNVGSGGPTLFVAANLPSLRPQDNVPGVYLFAQGVYSGWKGCDVYMAVDDGGELIFDLVDTITQASIMGRLVYDEPSGGEPITVRLWDSTDELENVTASQVLQGKNAAAIIDADDVAEIIGFEEATQDSAGDWDLTTISRAGLGTTEVPHLASERFVMLEVAHFLPVPAEFAGQTLVFRAVTIGTPVDSNPTTELVFEPPVFVLDGGAP